jgi:hypothetical protein
MFIGSQYLYTRNMSRTTSPQSHTLFFHGVIILLSIVLFFVAERGIYIGPFFGNIFPCTDIPGNSFPCWGWYDIGAMILAVVLLLGSLLSLVIYFLRLSRKGGNDKIEY